MTGWSPFVVLTLMFAGLALSITAVILVSEFSLFMPKIKLPPPKGSRERRSITPPHRSSMASSLPGATQDRGPSTPLKPLPQKIYFRAN
jgi:hypothetical protein